MDTTNTKKYRYVTCIVNMYKILLLRGYDLGDKIELFDDKMPLDDKCIALWGSTEVADFDELKEQFSYDEKSRNPEQIGRRSTKRKEPLFLYKNLVRYSENQEVRDLMIHFIGENGSAPSKSLIASISTSYAGKNVDVILVTKDKLSPEASKLVKDMVGEPDLPRIWHFLYQDMVKFVPEATMMPKVILYKDQTTIMSMISRYTSDFPDEKGNFSYKPDPRRAVVGLFDDMVHRIYGADVGDLVFYIRPNLDQNAMVTKIAQLRIVSSDRISEKFKK